jgi:hypothetical protein
MDAVVRELRLEFGDAACQPMIVEFERVGTAAGDGEIGGQYRNDGPQPREAIDHINIRRRPSMA